MHICFGSSVSPFVILSASVSSASCDTVFSSTLSRVQTLRQTRLSELNSEKLLINLLNLFLRLTLLEGKWAFWISPAG